MTRLFSNNKTKQIDLLAAQTLGINSFELMQLAGEAIYQHVKKYNKILVVTGPGNNGGDGFVVAELARLNGQKVQLLPLKPLNQLSGDAQKAAQLYRGSVITEFPQERYDCVVDAIFGTGLTKAVGGLYADAIKWINQQPSVIVAVDIPSGLNGTTGKIEGCVVEADQTISILAPNTGLFTLDGKDSCGDVRFERLTLPEKVFAEINCDGLLLDQELLKIIPQRRNNNSHKGQFGHVLTVGGQAGMMGAILLAGRAVLKSGAGLTTLVTDPIHANNLPLHAPELMTLSYDGLNDQSDQLLTEKNADVTLLGMGLGRTQWSKHLYDSCVQINIPMVMDADALYFLRESEEIPDQLKVITPHPKEAAMLLATSIDTIQSNRWLAVKQLADKFQCVAVLKGSGTLISDGQSTWCCPYGNANLATAGSGDVLAGMIAGLLAQGLISTEASCLAVIWHAMAGEQSQFGLTLTASDLLDSLHHIVK